MRSAPLLLIPVLALAGCAATPSTTTDDGTLQVVASTNVYGSIVESLGGEHVTVTSLIDSAAQDPHSYEASAQDQLAISKADLVIENGGGYDPFIDTLVDASGTSAVIISATDASALLDHDHAEDDHAEGEEEHADEEHAEEDEGHEGHDHIEGFNEHVWYSLHGIWHVAEVISEELTALDPDNAADYAANLTAFTGTLEQLEADAEALHAQTDGLNAAITEPVPLYLLEAAGFTNVTPDAFSEAIEEGTDVAPATLQQTLALFESGAVSLLAYNSQTASAETERVREAAEAAGVPVVEFTETLPDGADYLSWITDNLAAIKATLK